MACRNSCKPVRQATRNKRDPDYYRCPKCGYWIRVSRGIFVNH